MPAWGGDDLRHRRAVGAAVALRENDAAAMAAALYNVDWSRDHPKEARVMLLYRREELAVSNTDVEKAVMHHALRRYGKGAGAEEIRREVFALVDVPYAAGRRHLINGDPPPPLVDELVIKTLRCVLAESPGASDTPWVRRPPGTF